MKTLREKLDDILRECGIESSEQKGEIITKVIGLGRANGSEIIHRVGPGGHHQLVVDGAKSKWTAGTDIIRLNDYLATTDAYINTLPQVGRVYSLRDKDIRTESVQKLTD